MGDQENTPLEVKAENSSQETPTTTTVVTPKSSHEVRSSGKGKTIKIAVAIIIGLLVLGGGAWFILSEPESKKEPQSEPSLIQPETLTPTVAPTLTPRPVIKADVRIQILNGTGIAKEATFLQGKLRDLDYTEIELDNAETQDEEREMTTVTFSASIQEEVVEEITARLREIYRGIETKSSVSLADFDVLIITGLRKGYVAPTTVPTPQNTPTPTPDASLTPTPTPTGGPTPTPA